MKSNSKKDANFQKREKDASDWAMKSMLVIDAASLVYESYVKYCRNNGTKPLQILQLKSVLEYNFPEATVQNKEVQDEVESCKHAAKRLSHVITWMKDNGHTKILLRDFAHSASCAVTKCSPFCMMFRRVRRHVVSTKHQCVLLRLYSLLLRLHVNSCNNDNCGLQACPTLRANKESIFEETSTIANRPPFGTMIQRKRIALNPLLVSASASNNFGNHIVVVSAIPTNKLHYLKIKN